MKAWSRIAMLLTLAASAAQADSIQSEIAVALPQGAITFRSFVRFTEFAGSGSDTLEFQNQLAYGLTAKTNVLLSLPILRKRLEVGGVGKHTTGLGDMALLVKHQVWGQNRLQTQDRVALIGGIKLPTGDSHARDPAGPLPAMLWPGSGSFDFSFGAFYAHDSPTGLFADLLYTAKTQADGYRFGDTLRYDVALTRAFAGGGPRQHFVWGVLELNGVLTACDHAYGGTVASSGGHILYLSPGLRLVHWTGRAVVDLSYQIPLVTNLNGSQPAPRHSWLVGARANF